MFVIENQRALSLPRGLLSILPMYNAINGNKTKIHSPHYVYSSYFNLVQLSSAKNLLNAIEISEDPTEFQPIESRLT